MKKYISGGTLVFAFTFIALFLALSNNSGTYAREIAVDNRFDENLASCIQTTLENMNVTDYYDSQGFTDESLSKITKLTCTNLGIQTIDGLSLLTNLKFLDLSHNKLTTLDLSDDNNSKLKSVKVSFNILTDVMIDNKPNLHNLYLNDNELSSIDVNLPNPSVIRLYNNYFSEIPDACNVNGGNSSCTFGKLVTFYNGNSIYAYRNVESNKKISYMPIDPTKSGYTFAGWYKNKALTKKFNINSKINQDISLYAKFTTVRNDLARDEEIGKDNLFSKMMIIMVSLFVAACLGYLVYTYSKSKEEKKKNK